MENELKIPSRRSIRLKTYNYSKSGAYFITICAHQRKHLFGEIINETINLYDLGQIVRQQWLKSEEMRPGICLDKFVIMPNHFHGILIITGEISENERAHSAPIHLQKQNLGRIISGFKSSVTSQAKKLTKAVWQRNYYEHIVRDDESLNRIREYITYNPLNWHLDKENPNRTGTDAFDKWLKNFEKKP